MIESAVILAAGSGTRLKPLTDHSPKCLTEINSIPILINALENLDNLGIKNCTVVAGYFSEKIFKAIGSSFRNVQVSYILNEHYASTNDMYSLWLARHLLERGVLLLEGDIFFRYKTIERAFSMCANRTCYLNVLFDDVIGAHTDDAELLVVEVGHDEWVEVDTLEDVREAERVFA